ncbi:MAG TPA: hypothetical protein VJ654_18310 [Noviherbaspirillum sp.]|nr:hypothetical protein [Noviherbaspirillum sp.]
MTKLIASLLLAVLGAVAAFYPFAPNIPKYSELSVTSGVLLSAEFRSKKGSEIQIEGADGTFIYRSHGRVCGNVQDKLSAEIGNPISISHLAKPKKDWFGNDRPLEVFEISVQKGTICSFEQISNMIHGDFRVVPLLGYFMLFIGLFSAFSAISKESTVQVANTKNSTELRNELEIEEGERIIGEQWKNPPAPTDTLKR